MRKHKYHKSAVCIGLLAAGANRTASAGSTISTSYTHVTAAQTVTFMDTFNLPYFDPSLGTLTGITVSVSYSTNDTLGVYNATGDGTEAYSDGAVTTSISVRCPDAHGPLIYAVAGSAFGYAPYRTPEDIPGLTTSGTVPFTVPTTDYGSFEEPSATGNYIFNAFNVTGSAVADAGVDFSGFGTAGGSTTVTYTYSAVPEPASLGAFACGAALLLRRRRPVAGIVERGCT